MQVRLTVQTPEPRISVECLCGASMAFVFGPLADLYADSHRTTCGSSCV